MDANHQPDPYPSSATPQLRAIACVFVFIAIMALIFLVKTVNAAPDDHPLCRAMASTTVSGRLAEWDSSVEAWKDMPADLGDYPIDLLPIPDGSEWGYTSTYYLMFSASTMQLWVIPYRSLTFVTDGTHDACPALIYDLSMENE